MAVLALLGQSVAFFLAIVLARIAGIQDFRDYAVAAAVFILASSVATLGGDKYTLRVLPIMFVRSDWGRARGYLRFVIRRTLKMSALSAAGVIAIALMLGDILKPGTRQAIIIAALAIPLGALAHLALESLTAVDREYIASMLFRVLVPVTAFAGVAVLAAAGIPINGAMAILAWGPAWLLALGLAWVVARRSLPSVLLTATPIDDAPIWRNEARPFYFYRLAFGLLGQSALIVMAVLEAPAAAVGAYAAALSAAGLCTVLATATNRVYGRKLSVLLELRDLSGIWRLRAQRLGWILPGLALYLGTVVLFGGDLLRLFRSEFVEQGLPALYILALGASAAVVLALAPTYMKYQKRNSAIFTTVGIAVVGQVLLLVLLVPRAGATGAAAAYAISIVGMYGAFAWMGHRDLKKLALTEATARS